MSERKNDRRGRPAAAVESCARLARLLSAPEYSIASGKSQPVYNGQGRVVGVIEGGVYHKRLDPTRHKLDRPPGWAIDRDHLDLPWESIVIETTTGETWRATKDAFLTFGVRIDRGYGDQICLPDRFWRVERRGAPRQLELFRN